MTKKHNFANNYQSYTSFKVSDQKILYLKYGISQIYKTNMTNLYINVFLEQNKKTV